MGKVSDTGRTPQPSLHKRGVIVQRLDVGSQSLCRDEAVLFMMRFAIETLSTDTIYGYGS